ncbi:helix-turn-helix domain-containing protein [Serratia bockelmannii]|uniref:Helix-turn-helix domain-containing protein n=1 Tax=Serratia bockelmannii TaxID=2703793 RepID=A0ABT8LZ76_9GAMM|nr:helix-turn-helix domain-containing protein [Serratia bockelmannii]MDN6881934.1 helix-turn-helix domain-containing protein [Serratia bockelmannii]HBH6890281.1 response regulator [Serratia marcescens]
MNEMRDKILSDSNIGDVVSSMLSMQGIAKHKHVDHVKNVLSISPSQAHKKLKGQAQWEVTQLEHVITSIDLTMSQFYTIIEFGHADKVDAVLDVNNVEVRCSAYLLPEENSEPRAYSAIKINDFWHVFRTEDISENQLYMESKIGVGMISIESHALERKRPRIAILDDDIAIVESIKEIMQGKDYQIDIFIDIDGLGQALKSKLYDAYILDWIVKDRSVYELIRKIRESDKPNAMIITLTGQVGESIDKEIASAMNDFDILGPYSKPLRINSIQALVDKYFSNKS